MRIAIIVFILSMIYSVSWQYYKLIVLQNRVSCLQERVDKEWYLARYNARIFNHSQRLNDRNIEAVNENFEKIKKALGLTTSH